MYHNEKNKQTKLLVMHITFSKGVDNFVRVGVWDGSTQKQCSKSICATQ